jgi:hypothetical protein
MDGVSALYCACYRGHFHVAKTLIELGKANVNETTSDYRLDPLFLHATMKNRLDIVRFLVENRYADVNETKSLGFDKFTALMCASRACHTSLVQYLLDVGADVNYCSPDSYLDTRTALSFAVANGHLKLFVFLHQRGAKTDGSLLRAAVEHKSYSILRFLLNWFLITPDQLEIEATSFVFGSSSSEALQNWLDALRISLEYRQRTGLRKVCPPALEIYEYQEECQTIDELEKIVDDRQRMIIELVLIQDRLQSLKRKSSRIQLLEEYSEILVAKKRFDKCLDVCHHHLDLDAQYDGDSSLYLFIWLFCAILSSDHLLTIDRYLRVANLIFRPSYQKHGSFTEQRSLHGHSFYEGNFLPFTCDSFGDHLAILDPSTQ